MALKPVAEALADILAAARLTDIETIAIEKAHGRILAEDVIARLSQPSERVSAMDGYAVRAEDTAQGAVLSVTDQSFAGKRSTTIVQPRTAHRIFTGATIPDGADTVLMQENAEVISADQIRSLQRETVGRHIRPAGLDFVQNSRLLAAGMPLDGRKLALAAASGYAELAVRKRPRVGLLSSGDELVLPGQQPQRDQIIATNHLAAAALVELAGGEAVQLGIATDTPQSLRAAILRAQAERLDVLVTLGGASVGDRDLVQSALIAHGLELTFWKIAMRPGKPMIFGTLGGVVVLGLPGNPVSSYVCAHLFLAPLIRAMCGESDAGRDRSEPGVLGSDLPANDQRQDYLRATLDQNDERFVVTAFARQDSSMMLPLAQSQALLIREPFAKAAKMGENCRFVRL
jgi:molybdopterin molybdotransferase